MIQPRILVLGANGMLGSAVRQAASAGNVICIGLARNGIVNGAVACQASEAMFDAGSQDYPIVVAQLVERNSIDLVVNCVACLASDIEVSEPRSAYQAVLINGGLPHRLAESLAAVRANLIHISTDAVFRADELMCSEDTVPSPDSLYGSSKLVGEVYYEHCLTLRCSIIGRSPLKRRGLVEWVLSQPEGATIRGFVNQLWTGMTTKQLAGLILHLAVKNNFTQWRKQSAVYHLTPNKPLTKFDLLQLVVECFRPDLTVEKADGQLVTRQLVTKFNLWDNQSIGLGEFQQLLSAL